MKTGSGLNGATRGSITGSQIGIKQTKPARPVVQRHAAKSVNAGGKVPKSEGANVFKPLAGGTGLSNARQAAVYNSTGGKY